MAAANPLGAQPESLDAVLVNGCDHVIGTGRPKAASRRKKGRDKALVKPNGGN